MRQDLDNKAFGRSGRFVLRLAAPACLVALAACSGPHHAPPSDDPSLNRQARETTSEGAVGQPTTPLGTANRQSYGNAGGPSAMPPASGTSKF